MLGPFLREHSVFLAGADFIDGYLIEAKVTSPSAIRQIIQVSGLKAESRIIDSLLKKIV